MMIAQNTAWKNLRNFDIHTNPDITKTGKEELKKNPIFGSFVDV